MSDLKSRLASSIPSDHPDSSKVLAEETRVKLKTFCQKSFPKFWITEHTSVPEVLRQPTGMWRLHYSTQTNGRNLSAFNVHNVAYIRLKLRDYIEF